MPSIMPFIMYYIVSKCIILHNSILKAFESNALETFGFATKNATVRAVAFLRLWSRGELNPGPVTVPSVFYVRSLLAARQFFCPHVIADNSWRAYLQ